MWYSIVFLYILYRSSNLEEIPYTAYISLKETAKHFHSKKRQMCINSLQHVICVVLS